VSRSLGLLHYAITLTTILSACNSGLFSPGPHDSPGASNPNAVAVAPLRSNIAAGPQQVQTATSPTGISTGALAVMGLVVLAALLLTGYAVKKNGERRKPP
jgi:hypothetical protein